MRPTPDERFDAKVDRSGDCWIWTGATNNDGYGRFWLHGRLVPAHTLALGRVGAVLDGEKVSRTCDNASCVRPSHLFVGNPATTEAQLVGLRRAGAERWTQTTDERFDAKVNREGACWVWTGATNKGGYGRFWSGERLVPAHAFALERAMGLALVDGMEACHTCDNPPCVRPSHLFAGTRLDNMADMIRKGRDAPRFGEANGRAKLTAAEAAAIQCSTESHAVLARRYGVGRTQIGRIKRGENWSCASSI